MSSKKFRCTQRELYAVCASGWKLCLQHISKFSGSRPIYTPEYVESRIKDIAKVDAMPDRSVRSSLQDVARMELKEKLEEYHGAWKMLKSAMPSIFPESRLEAYYKEMGQDFYAESKQFKWEASTGLVNAGLAFAKKHDEELGSSALLGQGIVANLNSLAEAFHSAMDRYLDKRKESNRGSEDKIKACNELYKDLSFMLSDARIILRNEPAILKEFNFDTLLDFVSGHGSAGIKGNISNGLVPLEQIPDLLLTLLENGDEAYIDANGSYRFSQLAAGTYTIHVTAKGYQEQNIPGVTVNPGAYTMQHIKLVPEGEL
jgi:hypothetical protein